MSEESKVRAVQHIMATLFSAQNALRELAPEFRWAGLGNLLGDYGEFVAIKHYGLVKAPAGSNGYDATTPDGKTVQIKANHAASTIGFRGEADLLLVIKVEPDGQWTECYYGVFSAVKALARYSARDNKHMVHVRHLHALRAADQSHVSVREIDGLFDG
ncbi:hypothetical protein [Novosphingobium sp. PhB57]|uniref:DUF6998 domain-containing protein n=1 Tax=Novosphingobium sp. PhB57 TaxID=2485107 RepID=UPI001404BB05|nr:hypothetical protein [Novosphingobium sp. PhB57]